MATVNGMTAEAMEVIADASVVSGEVNEDGDLILTTRGGDEINGGSVFPGFETLYPSFRDLFFPVGCIFFSVVNTNPGTTIGGTWTAWGSGRVPVGVDTGQSEFNTVEETGGAKTHTLTTAQIPSHTHTQDAHNHTQDAHNHTQDAHSHAIGGTGTNFVVDGGGINGGASITTGGAGYAKSPPQSATATNQATTATNQATTATNQSTGGGEAHNNLQPYITCYMWKRTA